MSALLSVLVLVAVMSGCGVVDSASGHEADQHARAAATVMGGDGYEVPANDAAWLVAGHVGDTTIEAMALSGTSWNGAVTLRITVTHEAGGWGSDDTAVRCYRYRFDHTVVGPDVDTVDCPTGEPVVLTTPPQPDLGASGAAALATTLSAIAPDVRTPDGVQAVLTAAYPPPVGIGITPADGGLTIGVSFHGRCLRGLVPPTGPATVDALPSLTCRGG